MGTFTNLGLSNSSNVSFEVPVYEGFVEATGNGLMALTQESALDLHQLNSALYVADVVHEQTAMESAADAEILLENVIKDSLEKTKKWFINLWSKIKAWFKAAFVRLKNMFLHGKKFITENKKRLEAKNELGFTYTGRKITAAALADLYEKTITNIGKQVDDHVGDLNDAAKAVAGVSEDGSFKESIEEEKEKALKAIGYDELSELTKEIRLSVFNGEEPSDADEIKDFSANSKSELMELVSNSAKGIKELEKGAKLIDKEFASVIKSLNEAIKQANSSSDEDKTKAINVAIINRKINIIKYLITVSNSATAATVEAVQAATKEGEKILRKYISYKPAKEGYESFDGEEAVTESLLDRAMKLI